MKNANSALLGAYHDNDSTTALTSAEALGYLKKGNFDYTTGDTAVVPQNCYGTAMPRVMVINMINGKIATPDVETYFPLSQIVLLVKKINSDNPNY